MWESMSDLSKSRVVTRGSTSTIYHHQRPDKVVKVLEGKDARENFLAELQAYERLAVPGRSSSILRFFGVDEDQENALIFELASRGDLHSYIWHESPVDFSIKLKVARQAVDALAFVHSQKILHCDIHAINFFLDANENIKLGDFGAASIEGSRPRMMYRSSHQLWIKSEDGAWRKDISVASELFALGCVFYNLETRNGLFSSNGKEIDRMRIVEKLQNRDYPDLGTDFVLEKIIRKCWWVEYRAMTDLLTDIPPPERRISDELTPSRDIHASTNLSP